MRQAIHVAEAKAPPSRRQRVESTKPAPMPGEVASIKPSRLKKSREPLATTPR
jgi:hypothetical protein